MRKMGWSVRSRALIVVAVALCAGYGGALGAESPDWPEFRGPTGNGHVTSPEADATPSLPVRWSESENVVWKTATPNLGWSTPVVLENDIWITAATEDGHDYYAMCIDYETGDVRLNEHLFHTDTPEPLGNGVNCYASPSPVIEPGRVYVHFGSYGTACLDTATGKPIWKRDDLRCRHYRGPGSSAMLFENLLVLTFDGVDAQYVAALDKNTGDTVWKTDRTTAWQDLDESGQPKREGDFRKAYSTPLVYDTGERLELMSVGSSSAFAYDPRSGKELWMARISGYTPASRPVYGNGLVYFTSGRGKQELMAYRPGGNGDVTDSNLVWKMEGPEVPQESSPVLVDDLLFIVSNNATASCLEAATGEVLWQERLGGNFVASPIYGNGLLYFCNMQGEANVVKAARSFEVLSTNHLDAGFMASPAVKGNSLILRTKTHLYRIEDRAVKS
ncbi:MAG: hypothetical protein AMXMBFR84_35410 [Candidatus Hydrogenedentota bacterium]